MKNIIKFFALIALVAAMGLSMIACDGSTDESVKYTSVKGDNTYELTITSNSGRAYSPAKDDSYVLIIKVTATGDKIGESTGTVSLVSGGTLTLSSGGATFTVTVSSGEMTAITVNGGGNQGGGNGGSVTLSGTYYNMSWYQTRAEYAAELTKIGYGSKNGALADLIACSAPELMKKDAITFSGSTCLWEYYVIDGDFGGSRGDDGYWPITSLLYKQDIKQTWSYHVVGNNI